MLEIIKSLALINYFSPWYGSQTLGVFLFYAVLKIELRVCHIFLKEEVSTELHSRVLTAIGFDSSFQQVLYEHRILCVMYIAIAEDIKVKAGVVTK